MSAADQPSLTELVDEAATTRKCPHCPHMISAHGHGGCLTSPCRCITKGTNLRIALGREIRRASRRRR